MAIITISRGSLSGGELLAHQLGERLGYKVISREVIVGAAKKYGVSESKLLEGMDSPHSLWHMLTKHKEDYTLAIKATLAEMIEEGKVIYHGHAGHLLLKELSRVIKLRLIAPMDYRIRSAMEQLGMTREQAIKHVETVDDRRVRWVRQMYNVEWTDPTLYDLVLNLEHITMDMALELVLALARREEYLLTPEHHEELRDFSLRTRIQAEITFLSGFPEGAVEVKVRGGVVCLSGGSFFDKHKPDILAFVRKIRGVTQIEAGQTASILSCQEPHGDKTAGQVMLPISGYPFIHQWTTIAEAIAALSTSSIKLADGHVFCPRYILVHDELEALVGVVGRRDLLRGLRPQLKVLEKATEEVEALAHLPRLSFADMHTWISMFTPVAIANSKEPVSTVMAPIRAMVRPEDDLDTVITVMLKHAVDLVPVVEGKKAVGVVLMTDVFDSVAEYIMEGGSAAPKGL